LLFLNMHNKWMTNYIRYPIDISETGKNNTNRFVFMYNYKTTRPQCYYKLKKKRLRTAELVHKVESFAHCVCFLLCTGCKYIIYIYMLLMITLAFTVAYTVKEYIFLFNKIVYHYKRNVFYYNYILYMLLIK